MKGLFILLLTVLLTVTPALAYNSAFLEISVESDGMAHVDANFFVNSTGMKSFTLYAHNPRNVNVLRKGRITSFTLENNTITVENVANVKDFSISYDTDSLTSKEKSNWSVYYLFSSNTLFDYLGVDFSFPENVVVRGANKDAIMFLKNDKIVVRFEETLKSLSSFQVDYSFREAKGIDYSYLFLIVLLPLVSISGVYLVKKKWRRKFEVPDFLNEREKKVLKLVAKKGEINQKQICVELSLPKSTLSRILKKLERMNLIEIKNYGLINKIRVKRK